MMSALETAHAVRSGAVSAEALARKTIERIREFDPEINSFTAITEERALAEAEQIDKAVARGEDPGPLAGVPFAVKGLFGVRGLRTSAGPRFSLPERLRLQTRLPSPHSTRRARF